MDKLKFTKLFLSISLTVICIGGFLGLIAFSPSFSTVFDFSSEPKVKIATVIANLAAPILATISSILLYLALIKQSENNKFQVKKNELDMCFTLYNQLNVEYSTITIKLSKIKKDIPHLEVYHGHQALIESLNLIRGNEKNFAISFETDKFMSLITTYKMTEEAINNTQIDKDLKIMFENKLNKFYQYKLRPTFLLSCFLIRNNKDQISKDFMSFVLEMERKGNSNFDIYAFNNEREIFINDLDPIDK